MATIAGAVRDRKPELADGSTQRKRKVGTGHDPGREACRVMLVANPDDSPTLDGSQISPIDD